jgi:subtilisin family serine protease
MTGQRWRPWAVVVVCVLSLAAPAVVAAQGGTPAGGGRASLPSGAGQQAGALLVRFSNSASPAATTAAVAAAGGRQIGQIAQLRVRVVSVPDGRSQAAVERALLANPAVLSVEPDSTAQVTLTPDDPLWSDEWYARKVRSDRAWDITTGTNGPLIAVLDTGVYADQPDLSGRVQAGYDFVNNDADPADDNGHGTMVSGVLTARGMNELGVAGTCWDCRVLAVKVADQYGKVRWSNAAAGLVWATDNGAQVVNMSFGKAKNNSTMAAAVDYAISHGVIVVAAAGNKGTSAKFYPAAFPGVLSVAATTENDTLYSWSTYGSWVTLAAPGCTWTTKKSGKWGSFCGTSASAPIVAGVAGLILAYAPTATPAEVERAITSTAVNVTSAIGGGRVDAYAAVKRFVPKPGHGHH